VADLRASRWSTRLSGMEPGPIAVSCELLAPSVGRAKNAYAGPVERTSTSLSHRAASIDCFGYPYEAHGSTRMWTAAALRSPATAADELGARGPACLPARLVLWDRSDHVAEHRETAIARDGSRQPQALLRADATSTTWPTDLSRLPAWWDSPSTRWALSADGIRSSR
jgi:hypothetical protein